MDTITNRRGSGLPRTLIFLVSSFTLAFCLQIVVHESGHYIFGMLTGAKHGRVILHPFYNSQVLFGTEPSVRGQILTGIMGPALDLIAATLITVFLWKKKTPLVLPFLAWGSLAFFGEGLGIIGSLSMYSGNNGIRYYEDITQLCRLGVQPLAILVAAIIFTLAGSILMALIMPLAGIKREDNFLKRLCAYAVYLPLYFFVAVLYIKLFSRSANNLDVRTGQLVMAAISAILLAILHKPIQALMGRVLPAIPVMQPNWKQVIILSGSSAIALALLIIYNGLHL